MTTLLIQNLLIAVIAASFLFDLGRQEEEVQFRGVASKITITSPSTSPALAAYKDLYDPIIINQVEPVKQKSVELVAGRSNYKWQPDDSESAVAIAYVDSKNEQNYKNLSGIKFAKTLDTMILSDGDFKAKSVAGYTAWTKKTKQAEYNVISTTTSTNKKIIAYSNDRTKVKEQSLKPVQPVDDKYTVSSVDDSMFETKTKVNGSIEFEHGLALLDEYSTLSVIYNYAGSDRQTVRVDNQSGEFNIDLNKWGGVLYAEMRDRSGHLRGLGEINLLNIKPELAKNLSIKVAPVDSKVHAVVVSGYSYEEDIKPVSGAEVKLSMNKKPLVTDNKGQFVVENNLPGSSQLISIEKPSFWPTLASLTTYKRNIFKLYSKSSIDSLLKLSFDNLFYENASRMGIVLGRVTLNGEDLGGAEVEISTDTSQPVYFNAFVPDTVLKQTTDNGKFAVFMLDEGVHALRVKYDNKYFPAEVVAIRRGHITHVNIDIKPEETTQVSIVDHSTGVGVDADITLEGQEQLTSAPVGEAQIRFSSSQNFLELVVQENTKYPSYRTKLFKQEYYKKIRVLKKANIRTLIADIDELVAQEKSFYLGTVLNDNYYVDVESLEKFDFEVVYFDKELNRVTSGIAGGGFILIANPVGVAQLQVYGVSTENEYHEFIGANTGSVGLSLIDFSAAFN